MLCIFPLFKVVFFPTLMAPLSKIAVRRSYFCLSAFCLSAKSRLAVRLATSAFIVMLGSVAGCSLGEVATDTDTPLRSVSKTSKTVTVFGRLVGKEQANFEAAVRPFEEETGIDVIYEGSESFASLLRIRAGVLNFPDVVIISQPGLMAEFVRSGDLVPLSDFMDRKERRAAYSDSWLDLGMVDDETYAIWYRAAVKSLVWYRPSAFEAKGYDIPTTWEALIALSDRIVSEGGTPWCIGIESGAATGWTGTDWIEDIMLRTTGPEAYRQWVEHEMPFNAPPVVDAFDKFGQFLLTPKYVSGSAAQTVNIPYRQSPLGLFDEPPSCYMHRQASFISASFPAGKLPRVDYDIFPLPGIDARFGLPILVAGESISMFNDTPESRALMIYLASPEPHEISAQLGGFISPQKQVSPEAYSDIVNQRIAQILANADVIQFDGSDMMPAYVGTDTFWDGMIDFAQGKSAEAVTNEIEENWPN